MAPGWSRCWRSPTRRWSWTRKKSESREGRVHGDVGEQLEQPRQVAREAVARRRRRRPCWRRRRGWPPGSPARRRAGWPMRVFVPSVTIAAVKLATPGRSAGSRAAPPSSSTRWTATMGSRWYSTSRTERPLPSVNFCCAGSFSSAGGPSGGTAPGGRRRGAAGGLRRLGAARGGGAGGEGEERQERCGPAGAHQRASFAGAGCGDGRRGHAGHDGERDAARVGEPRRRGGADVGRRSRPGSAPGPCPGIRGPRAPSSSSFRWAARPPKPPTGSSEKITCASMRFLARCSSSAVGPSWAMRAISSSTAARSLLELHARAWG